MPWGSTGLCKQTPNDAQPPRPTQGRRASRREDHSSTAATSLARAMREGLKHDLMIVLLRALGDHCHGVCNALYIVCLCMTCIHIYIYIYIRIYIYTYLYI